MSFNRFILIGSLFAGCLHGVHAQESYGASQTSAFKRAIEEDSEPDAQERAFFDEVNYAWPKLKQKTYFAFGLGYPNYRVAMPRFDARSGVVVNTAETALISPPLANNRMPYGKGYDLRLLGGYKYDRWHLQAGLHIFEPLAYDSSVRISSGHAHTLYHTHMRPIALYAGTRVDIYEYQRTLLFGQAGLGVSIHPGQSDVTVGSTPYSFRTRGMGLYRTFSVGLETYLGDKTLLSVAWQNSRFGRFYIKEKNPVEGEEILPGTLVLGGMQSSGLHVSIRLQS